MKVYLILLVLVGGFAAGNLLGSHTQTSLQGKYYDFIGEAAKIEAMNRNLRPLNDFKEQLESLGPEQDPNLSLHR